MIDGVTPIKARIAATSWCGHEPPASIATLAVLNSAPGAESAAAVVSEQQNWVEAVAIAEGLGVSMKQAAARKWCSNMDDRLVTLV